jgi:hypothetical protein
MNINYTTYFSDIITGYEDNDYPIYQRDENGKIQKEKIHSFQTEPFLRIDITENGPDPLGRYNESYTMKVMCGTDKLWTQYRKICTLQQAKEMCENKLKQFAQEQLTLLQKFLQ